MLQIFDLAALKSRCSNYASKLFVSVKLKAYGETRAAAYLILGEESSPLTDLGPFLVSQQNSSWASALARAEGFGSPGRPKLVWSFQFYFAG